MSQVQNTTPNGQDNPAEVADLELHRITGFDGITKNGLQVHPDKINVVYPLGMNVIIQNWITRKQHLLTGHTGEISALAVSPDGKYIASGQRNHRGFKAYMILWDFKKRVQVAKHKIHKVCVESVSFSCKSRYVISLGAGKVVVWDILKEKAMCGFTASTATSGNATVLCATNRRDQCFVSGGAGTMRVWRINPDNKNVRATEVTFGVIKRVVTCIVLDSGDSHAFCGTTTGDVAKVRLNYDSDPDYIEPASKPVLIGCLGIFTGKKVMPDGSFTQGWSKGVTALCIYPIEMQDLLIVGSGDGIVELVKERHVTVQEDGKLRSPSELQYTSVNSANVGAEVTSLQMFNGSVIVGTAQSEIYMIDLVSFEVTLRVTCHTRKVLDIAFPPLYPDVFATCDDEDIRVWDAEAGLELLRISMPDCMCNSIVFTFDGKSIISGWGDGNIRAFSPQSGRLMYTIVDAHNIGVTAVAVTSDGRRIISGGKEGQVHVWDIKPERQELMAVLKEHTNLVSHISVAQSDEEAVSASWDGTCIIWDIVQMTQKHVLCANTLFDSVVYHPGDLHILTFGTDCKIGFWKCYDGSLIREIEEPIGPGLNSVDITRDGNYFATGGCAMNLKVWKYKDGVAVNYGVGQSSSIYCVKFSPDSRFIVSAGIDGSIFCWKCPYPLVKTEDDNVNSAPLTCRGQDTAWSKPARGLWGLERGRKGDEREENASEYSSPLLEDIQEDQSPVVRSCVKRYGKAADLEVIPHENGCPAGRATSKNGPFLSKRSSRGKPERDSKNLRRGTQKKN